MNPEAVLSLLIQTRAQLPDAPDTPFLLQRNAHAPLSLSHPMIPDGGFVVDSDMETALASLVQWGYLTQTAHDQGTSYLVAPGGLSYAAHENDPPWNGNERRSGRRPPDGVEQRVKSAK